MRAYMVRGYIELIYNSNNGIGQTTITSSDRHVLKYKFASFYQCYSKGHNQILLCDCEC